MGTESDLDACCLDNPCGKQPCVNTEPSLPAHVDSERENRHDDIHTSIPEAHVDMTQPPTWKLPRTAPSFHACNCMPDGASDGCTGMCRVPIRPTKSKREFRMSVEEADAVIEGQQSELSNPDGWAPGDCRASYDGSSGVDGRECEAHIAMLRAVVGAARKLEQEYPTWMRTVRFGPELVKALEEARHG